jgi:hypothetical protein
MSDALNLVWLAAAVVAAILVMVLALRLSRTLAELIGQGHGLKAASITPSQTLLLARLAMVGLALVAAQALLRWPLALVLGRDGAALQVDAGIAAVALAGVLTLLVWVYQTARPMLHAVTLRAIDAAIPTTGEALVVEPTRTSASMVRDPIPSSTDAVTVVAPLFAQPLAGEAGATLVAGRASDATVRAEPDADPTVRAGTDPEATLRMRDP